MRVGLISYDTKHLKTEQLALNYSKDPSIDEITILALPFLQRKNRNVIFSHRPDMNDGVYTKELQKLAKTSYAAWDGKQDLSSYFDVFIIGGAGILNTNFAGQKPIINAHPGIIPLTRGLDAFKWAIYNNDPIGISLHQIDDNVDSGELMSIRTTEVFETDTITSVSRRHYEHEIAMLSNFMHYLHNRAAPSAEEKPATLRMNERYEREMLRRFDVWKRTHSA